MTPPTPRRRLLESAAVVAAVLGLVVVPTAVHGWPTTARGYVFLALVCGGGLALLGWRDHPRATATTALGLSLASLAVDGWYPDPALILFSAAFVVFALAWSGRPAWVAAAGLAAYLVVFATLLGHGSEVAVLVFTLPPYAAGTVLRLRRETADQLALRVEELEAERAAYAEIALRHERARIAGELHDIVGHAVSVMVIQAAAGQRLAEADPERAREAFAAISESARQGQRDLERLVELLETTDPDPHGPDLALVGDLVARAARSGLRVTCRLEGDTDGVPAPVARAGFRVVQESLTNALRHAPGAAVRIRVAVAETGVLVRVENDGDTATGPIRAPLIGTGRGLVGLRERVLALGGQFTAGATGADGWAVEARLPS